VTKWGKTAIFYYFLSSILRLVSNFVALKSPLSGLFNQ